MSLTPAQLENGIVAAQDNGLIDVTASQVLAIWRAIAPAQLEAMQAEIEILECALRVELWNKHKGRGKSDDAAIKSVNATIEAIKTDALASLTQGQDK